jgi:2-polyprenyl-3-methyl-5-hydroxy-6-metoxy-1,4-benzoquinol methylase
MYQSARAWDRYYNSLRKTAQALVDPATGLLHSRYAQKISCPCCKSNDHRLRYFVDGFTYVTCSLCGSVYMNPQPTEETIRRVYNDEEARRIFFNEVLLPFGERDQRPDFQQRAKFLRSLIENSSPQLLDIGCAAGNFLEIAGAAGFHCEGLELNEMYIDYIRLHRPSIKVADKRLEEMNYPPEYFDAVTLWDVLEHLPRPNDVLQEIARILKPSGILGFSTINHACINERLLRSRWRYYMPPDHVCSFTPKLLISMLRTHGFSIISMRHHYMFEVLFDSAGGWLHLSKKNTTLAAISNKIRKVLFSLMARGSELIFNALRSGDLLTVYARKNDQERITP